MKNSAGAMLLLVLCLAVCAQEAYSRPWWKRIPKSPSPLPAPIDSGSKPPLPDWLHPPTADEIARCESARDFNTKWKPCLDEGLQEKRSGNLTVGLACCSFIEGVVDGCYSKFPPQIQDVIYPPLVKEHCARYHN